MKQEAALILFDLDGTLIDSAPDLAGATNEMLLRRGLSALPLAQLRPHVGSGARGMLSAAFGIAPGHADFEPLKAEWFVAYEARLLRETFVFPVVAQLLAQFAQRKQRFGIVTNKAERYALPVCHGLGLAETAVVIVGGDTTSHRKPHPAPLLEAARRAGVAPEHCIYVGDDERDVIAGRAAGMRTVAVRWGYVDAARPIAEWGADHLIDTPSELLDLIDQALAKN